LKKQKSSKKDPAKFKKKISERFDKLMFKAFKINRKYITLEEFRSDGRFDKVQLSDFELISRVRFSVPDKEDIVKGDFPLSFDFKEGSVKIYSAVQSFHVARHIATKLKIAKFKKLLDKLFVENIKYSYVRRILCGFVQNGWCSKEKWTLFEEKFIQEILLSVCSDEKLESGNKKSVYLSDLLCDLREFPLIEDKIKHKLNQLKNLNVDLTVDNDVTAQKVARFLMTYEVDLMKLKVMFGRKVTRKGIELLNDSVDCHVKNVNFVTYSGISDTNACLYDVLLQKVAVRLSLYYNSNVEYLSILKIIREFRSELNRNQNTERDHSYVVVHHNHTYHLVRRTINLYDVINKHQVPYIDSECDEKSISSRGSQRHSASDKLDDDAVLLRDVTKANVVTIVPIDLPLSDVLIPSVYGGKTMTIATNQLLPDSKIEEISTEIKNKRIILDLFVDRDVEAKNLLELSKKTKLNINTMQVYLNENSQKSMDILASMTECKKCKIRSLEVYNLKRKNFNRSVVQKMVEMTNCKLRLRFSEILTNTEKDEVASLARSITIEDDLKIEIRFCDTKDPVVITKENKNAIDFAMLKSKSFEEKNKVK